MIFKETDFEEMKFLFALKSPVDKASVDNGKVIVLFEGYHPDADDHHMGLWTVRKPNHEYHLMFHAKKEVSNDKTFTLGPMGSFEARLEHCELMIHDDTYEGLIDLLLKKMAPTTFQFGMGDY